MLNETPTDDEDNIPVRILKDFAIFEESSRRLIAAEAILSLTGDTSNLKDEVSYAASGIVLQYSEDDDSDSIFDQENETFHAEDSLVETGASSTPNQGVMLSTILEANLHHFDMMSNTFDRSGFTLIFTRIADLDLRTEEFTYARRMHGTF